MLILLVTSCSVLADYSRSTGYAQMGQAMRSSSSSSENELEDITPVIKKIQDYAHRMEQYAIRPGEKPNVAAYEIKSSAVGPCGEVTDQKLITGLNNRASLSQLQGKIGVPCGTDAHKAKPFEFKCVPMELNQQLCETNPRPYIGKVGACKDVGTQRMFCCKPKASINLGESQTGGQCGFSKEGVCARDCDASNLITKNPYKCPAEAPKCCKPQTKCVGKGIQGEHYGPYTKGTTVSTHLEVKTLQGGTWVTEYKDCTRSGLKYMVSQEVKQLYGICTTTGRTDTCVGLEHADAKKLLCGRISQWTCNQVKTSSQDVYCVGNYGLKSALQNCDFMQIPSDCIGTDVQYGGQRKSFSFPYPINTQWFATSVIYSKICEAGKYTKSCSSGYLPLISTQNSRNLWYHNYGSNLLTGGCCTDIRDCFEKNKVPYCEAIATYSNVKSVWAQMDAETYNSWKAIVCSVCSSAGTNGKKACSKI